MELYVGFCEIEDFKNIDRKTTIINYLIIILSLISNLKLLFSIGYFILKIWSSKIYTKIHFLLTYLIMLSRQFMNKGFP